MSKSIRTILHTGSEGYLIDVECNLSQSLPTMTIVGLGNKSIDEARERIRSAFSHSKLAFPNKRIVINLAPADIPKDTTSFDLAIAVAILEADNKLQQAPADTDAFVGELGLDGRVRAVRGIIGKLVSGKKLGIERFYIPRANLEQALLVPDISVVAISTLFDLFCIINGTVEQEIYQTAQPQRSAVQHTSAPLDDIVGQEQAKRALAIAAAGGHNIFLNGPPGTGKSMLAKAFSSLLPAMSTSDILEVTHIHSLANHHFEQLITERPFRAPHHSASQVSIVGGGRTLKPGEISLSHRGVLFLDEMPEFTRATLEALRQPMEDRLITIARAKESVQFPANFILIATANPCPCGYYNSTKPCSCSMAQIVRYKQRVSGPILDRIDLHVTVDAVDHAALLHRATKVQQSQDSYLALVSLARNVQQSRFASDQMLNAMMDNATIIKQAHVSEEAEQLLNAAAASLQLSARSYMRTVKVARTIADMEDREKIETLHITEALQYRPQTSSPLME